MTDGRTEPITFYLSEDEKQAIQREADDADRTLSSHVAKLVRKQRKRDAEEEISENLGPEQRIEELTAQATEQIEESVGHVESVASDLRDIQARSAVYPIINFRMLQRQYGAPEAWINDEFSRASDKLTQPIGEHDPTEGIATDDDLAGDEGTDDGDDSGDDLSDRLGR